MTAVIQPRIKLSVHDIEIVLHIYSVELFKSDIAGEQKLLTCISAFHCHILITELVSYYTVDIGLSIYIIINNKIHHSVSVYLNIQYLNNI